MISVELTNKAEILQLMNRLPRIYESKVVRKFLKYAVAPLVARAKQLAPVSARPHKGKYGMVMPGTLQKSIGTIDMKRSRKVALVVGLRVRGAFGKVRSGYYGQWIERGTKKIAARPFMRPAYDLTKEEIIKRFERDAKRVFEKEIARLTKKGLI